MDTNTLRQAKLRERDALDRHLALEWSAVMADTLSQTFEYQQCEKLHVYISIGSEPATRPLIEKAWDDGKTVFVPSIDPDTLRMEHLEYAPGDELTDGMYGVPEPKGKKRLSDPDVTAPSLLAIVPLVAFNERLVRMGYGKGYYDRFLEHRMFFAFGLAYTCAFADEFRPKPHDAGLDAIVTEQGIVRARKSSGGPISISL